MRKNGELTFVQCKHWKSRNVGVKVVRELYGVMTAKKVKKGIVVTFGRFTHDAKEFAKGKPINLIAGNQLLKLISEVQNSSKIATQVDENITCPKCGGEMVLRVAKKESMPAKSFGDVQNFQDAEAY